MTTDNTIGICSDCKAQFDEKDPRIGYLCSLPITVKAKSDKEKDQTFKCQGTVVRHRKTQTEITGSL